MFNIAKYDVSRVGTDVKEQLQNDLKLESAGVKAYNKAIELCIKAKDSCTGRAIWGHNTHSPISPIGARGALARKLGNRYCVPKFTNKFYLTV